MTQKSVDRGMKEIQAMIAEAGDFLRVFEKHSKLGRCHVAEIHRQIPADYRLAVTEKAASNVRQGLEGLGRPNLVKRQRRTSCASPIHQRRNLDRCLAVSFTWDENHRFTNSILKGLKERAVLPAEGTRLQVHESLRLDQSAKARLAAL